MKARMLVCLIVFGVLIKSEALGPGLFSCTYQVGKSQIAVLVHGFCPQRMTF